MSKEIEYHIKPQGEVLEAYAMSRARVSSIIGPLGSGKTVQTCQKIFTLMTEQGIDENNERHSRWYAVRNTYSDLMTTTIKDWRELYEDLGKYTAGSKEPPKHMLDFWLEDGTHVISEMVFIALDRPASVKKVRGSQLTGVWLNEMKELPKAVVDMLDLRHGRYPKNRTWHGMLGDSNAPDVDHWLYALAEKDKPVDWEFFKQPGGLTRDGVKQNGKINWVLNKNAENLPNLPDGYYDKGMQGKSDDWISVNLANEYGFVSDGKPIFPEYRDDLHCQPLEFIPRLPIYRGWDFGTAACVLMQHTPRGQLAIQKEFVATKTMGIDRFADFVKRECATLYDKEYEFIDIGDPSGNATSLQKEGTTCFSVLAEKGIYVIPGKQDPDYRLDSVRYFLNRLVDGLPALIVDGDECPTVRKGFQGGYCMRRMQVSGEVYADKPDKRNPYSHPHDCIQYVCGYLRTADDNPDDEQVDEWANDDLSQAGQ